MQALLNRSPLLVAYYARDRLLQRDVDVRQVDKQRDKTHRRIELGPDRDSLPPNELLKKFHMSPNKDEVAEANATSLTEKFFVVADAMLKMAEKEGNDMMKSEYIRIIQAAMTVRQRTLRPEIRLLNELMMASTSPQQREEKIGSREGGETLVMNDKYFFGLLEGMIEDLGRREEGLEKQAVMRQVKDLEQRCRLRAQQYEETGD